MRFFNYPFIAKFFFKRSFFSGNKKQKSVYITIDDCSEKTTTLRIAEFLYKNSVQATFFCIGKYLDRQIISTLKRYGHSLGNHTFSHLNGLNCATNEYLKNIEKFDAIYQTRLFRPPYGKMKLKQYKELIESGKKIILWNLMSYDFDNSLNEEKIIQKIFRKTRNGTVVVFHCNEKTKDKIKEILNRYVNYLKINGFKFEIFKE